MCRTGLWLAIAAWWLAPTVSAAPAEQAQPRLVVESVQVNLVNVDIWAADAGGAPVAGLTAEDFELFEDGRPLPISNFSELPRRSSVLGPAAATIPATATGEGSRPRADDLWITLLIDNESISAANRNTVLERVRGLLEQLIADGRARVLLATASPTVRLRLRRSATADTLAETLVAVEHEAASQRGYQDDPMVGRFLGGFSIGVQSAPGGQPGPAGQPSSRDSAAVAEAEGALQQIRDSAQQVYGRAKAALASISRLLDGFSGVPGRKVLIYIGDGIPVNPGAEALNAWEARFAQSGAVAGFTGGLERERTTLAPVINELVGRANASGVTFLCVDTATNKQIGDSSAETRRAYDGLPLDSGGGAGRREFLQALAAGTGGRVLGNTTELGGDVARTLDENSGGYSLGYAPGHSGDGKLHTIMVKTRRTDVRVRHRVSYVDKSADDQMVDRTLAALQVGEAANDLAISLSPGTEITQRDGTYVVPVVVNIPVGGLVLLPKGDVHVGTVSIWVAVTDEDGRMSQPSKQTFTFRVANERLFTALSQSVSYPVQLLMKPGNKRLVASLRDDHGLSTGTAIAEFPVPRVTAAPGGFD